MNWKKKPARFSTFLMYDAKFAIKSVGLNENHFLLHILQLLVWEKEEEEEKYIYTMSAVA